MKKLYVVSLCLCAFHGSLAAGNAAATVDQKENAVPIDLFPLRSCMAVSFP